MSRLLLRAASWIVPADGRRAWLDEWRAELWHVHQFGRVASLRFCLGAFPDALWLRRHDPAPRPAFLASPARCLATLAALAALAFALRPVERIPEEVVAVREHSGRLTLTFDQYRAIGENRPSAIAAVAFYRPVKHGPAIATPGMADVLRGSPLPDRHGHTTVADPGPGRGYVLARVPKRPVGPAWHIRIPSPDGGAVLFDCAPVAPRMPFVPFVMILGAALTIVAAGTRFSLSAMPLRAWIFLAVKVVLVWTAVWFAAQFLAAPILPQALIAGFVLATRWALDDQRRRCPVCLRRVTNPVSFGCLSHILLDWHGAEFVCPRGHGLMQVSATFASPYAAQQWVRL
jgi:hypothetical protein